MQAHLLALWLQQLDEQGVLSSLTYLIVQRSKRTIPWRRESQSSILDLLLLLSCSMTIDGNRLQTSYEPSPL